MSDPHDNDEIETTGVGAEVLRAGAQELGEAALRVFSHAVIWSLLGLLLGGAALGVDVALGLFSRSLREEPHVYVLAFASPLAGLIVLGYAGALRGVGRTASHFGVDKGWFQNGLEQVLRAVTQALRHSEKIDAALDRSETALRDIPLERWEQSLHAATAKRLGDGESGRGRRHRIAQRIRGILDARVETYLLKIVRAESTRSGGGGVSMSRVRELALEEAEEALADLVESFMNRQTLLLAAGLLFGLSLAPLLLLLSEA